MEDFIIQLAAKLDTKLAIEDLKNLEKVLAEKGIKLKPILDTAVLRKEISNIAKEMKSILGDIEPQYNNISIRQYESAIKKVLKEQEKLNNLQQKNFLAEQQKYYQRIIDSNKKLYTLKNKLLSSDEKQTVEISKQVKALEQRNKYNYSQINKKGLNSSTWEQEVNRNKNILENQYKINQTKLQDLKITKEINQAEQIRKSISNESVSKKFIKAETSYKNLEKLGYATKELENNFLKLEASYNSLGKSNTDHELISNFNLFDSQLKQLNNEIGITHTKLNKTLVPLTELEKVTFANQIKAWRKVNTAAEKEYGHSLDELLLRLDEIDKRTFQQSFSKIKLEATAAGSIGKNFMNTMKTNVRKFAEWTFSSGLYMGVWQNFKGLVANVHSLDDALTNINYTMSVSDSQLEEIGISALQTSKELHTSVSNVLDAIKTYANAKETAQSIIDKSKPTIMMGNVTGMDTQQTVDILQGTMEQFDLTEDELMHISDVFQKVSQNMPYDFAKGVRELSEGIQASGSAAKDAGFDLESYTALLGTLIYKTRQSGSELGRSLRTMMLRTTKASSSALASKEITEDDLSNAEKALRRVGIEVRSDVDTFKDFDQTMGELYEKIDTLSDVDLSNLAYELAGIRQANIFKMMIKSYGDYLDMADKAQNADGVTLENQQKYAESLSGKLGELSAIWTSIGDKAIHSSWLKGLTDVGISLSSIVEKIGLLKTMFFALGIYSGLKNVGGHKMFCLNEYADTTMCSI